MAIHTEHTVISLFSGIGGLDLAFKTVFPNSRTVCYVERQITAVGILAGQMAKPSGLDDAPVYSDVTTFPPPGFLAEGVSIDFLLGGFPCQSHSQNGRKLHGDDPRELSGEVIRLADRLGLPTLFLENVPGILRFYWDNIRPKLREMGYEVEEGLFAASEVGASHRRERLFILAHANGGRGWENLQPPKLWAARTEQSPSDCGETESEEDEQVPTGNTGDINKPQLPEFPPGPGDPAWEWIVEHYPELAPSTCDETECSVRDLDDHGYKSNRLDGLMALGNSVVPAQGAYALRHLVERFK